MFTIPRYVFFSANMCLTALSLIKIPPAERPFTEYLRKSSLPELSFFFKPVTPSEIQFQILSIPNSKSHGLYSCPTQLLKYLSEVISPVLSDILNTSVSLGAYPQKLKMSKIIPIIKADDETDTFNYRPIPLLSNFNRIFGKIMYDRIRDFIEKAQPIIFVSIWLSSSLPNPTCYSRYGRNYTNQYEQKTLFMWRFY